jgi:starch synthase
VITNDWFTAFTPGYARDQRHFGDIFSNTSFLHIFHNLDVTYEGRFYTSPGETLEHIHNLPNEWLIDPYWSDHIVNPSRCALMAADQWSSVSKSYRDQIKHGSPLAPLLNKFNHPFACSNGVDVKERTKVLGAELGKRGLKHMDHLDAKRFLMEKYLNSTEVDPDLCIFSFVGRITEQKGVDVICSVVEEFVTSTNYKTAFIVGGPATKGDPHGDHVIGASDYLREKFPKNFYADPRAFFFDVPVLSLGSNFCLMPSRFEPGGIVQHEFFIAGTPAVVFATGGLKDSVSEYNYHTGEGNGFEFLNYSREDLLQALHRAYKAFKNKEVYRRLRKNAKESAIDVADVSKEWCGEVYRLRGKVFVDKAFTEGIEEETKESVSEMLPDSPEKFTSDQLIDHDFTYYGKATDKIYVVGSFNDWSKRDNRMSYNHITKEFHCKVKLTPEVHHYKLFVNGKWILDKNSPSQVDENGNEVSVLDLSM